MPGEGTSSLRHSDAPCFSQKSSPGVGSVCVGVEMGYILDGVVIGASVSMT